MTTEQSAALRQISSMLQSGALHGGTITQRKQFVIALEQTLSGSASLWVSTLDRPLIKKDGNGYWECTEDGDKEFIAAVYYTDSNRPNERNLWWIRHCVIEDSIGLCVVGDDCNEPAPWDIEDVTHYIPLPNHP